MTLRSAAVLFAAVTASAAAQDAKKTDAEIAAALGEHLKAAEAAGEFSGAVLLAKGDEVLYRGAVGLASRESKAANTPETKFNLGSINKAFTRLVVEQLAAEGKLALADPVGRYVPEYPAAAQATLQQLIEHRGGTGDFFGPRYDAFDKSRLRTLRDWLPLFADLPLEFEPGASERYSNVGYHLLGLVIEKVTGRSYYDVVRDRIFAPAGMKDTDSYPADAEVANRATGYTKTGESNRAGLAWRASSAGGGFSTVDDMRRFADALRSGTLGGAKGGAIGIAGGGAGVNAVLEMAGDYTLVVLGNLDPPAAGRVAGKVREWLGLPAGDGGRRMRRPGGASAGGPDPLAAPRTSAIPEAGAEVPMLRHDHMPAVQVMVNGQGPFLFAIDSGAAGTARVDTALAERLGLAKIGEVMGGDPSGRHARSMDLVAIDSIQVGEARFEGLQAAVRDMRVLAQGRKADGILGFGLFAECLLTLDYPGSVVRMARGALPAAAGVIPFTRERGIPVVRITVAGREMEADIDSGFMGGIALPEAEAARLPLASPPKVIGRAQTVSNSFEIKAAPLDGDVAIGPVVLAKPMVEIQPLFPTAHVGARALKDLAVTFDQKTNRMRVSRP